MNVPSSISDPLAARTGWTPLVPGGANFVTHRLVADGPSRFVMKASVGLTLFGLAFLGAGGLGVLIGAASSEWLVSLFGAPFLGVGGYVLSRKAGVFDGQARHFQGKSLVPFASIHALQILRETVSGSEDPDFDSFELNLVLTNGERVNVTDHAGLQQVRGDAQKLSALLGCKVWDATAP